MKQLLLGLLLLAALPSVANAATVRVDSRETPADDPCHKSPSGCPPRTTVVFTVASGEANDVTIALENGVFLVRDAGAPLVVGAGCTRVDDHAANCGAFLGIAPVDLRDGNDRMMGGATVSGGDGDDVLTVNHGDGGRGNDVVSCDSSGIGLGGCQLSGGPGADRVTGGSRTDTISGGPGGQSDDDLLDGGRGFDMVSYAGHRASVHVDLVNGVTRPLTPAGERDEIKNFEAAIGGDGDDVLTSADVNLPPRFSDSIWMSGGKGDDHIRVLSPMLRAYGDAGNDRIVTGWPSLRAWGGPGNDVLHGGPQSDALFGNEGNDILRAYGGRDVARGGSGADKLQGGPGNDRLLGGGGADLFRGGPGNDMLEAKERPSEDRPVRDFVDCGAGRRDRVTLDPRDRVARCEAITAGR